MPFGSIQLRPGVNTIATPTLNQAGISSSNLIRFRGGFVEKMGGWLRFISAAMDSLTRALHAWQDLTGNSWLAAGNLTSLDVIVNSALINLTPQTLISNPSVNPTINCSTIAGSTTVSIIDNNINNLISSDSVFMNVPISVGGLLLTAGYAINPTPSGTSYTITALSPATSTVNNGGTCPIFTTTLGSASVNVLLPNHGLVPGGQFVFPISTLVGGVTISGIYKNIVVVDSSNFTVTASAKAISASTVTMNGGKAQYLYGLATGPSLSVQSGGFGPLGQFALGEGFVVVSAVTTQTGTPITATDWTLDNWGEILLACPRGGYIWYWPPNSGFTTMIPVATGPAINNGIFVAMPAQILVAWGSTASIDSGNTDAAQDKLIVRWSDQLNFLNWQVSSLTQAGSFHIPTGSEIRGGIQGSNIALIFTDIDVWSMTYIGYPLIFGFNKIFSSGGLLGAHAVCEMRGSVYWMSNDNFYVCQNGSINVLPCTVWDNVFQDLDTANAKKVVAAAHPDFNEIFFFYPSVSGATKENDKYVKFNAAENVWDFGIMGRSAWQTRSVLGPPIGADPATLYLQQHEMSYSADGNPMIVNITTGYTAMGDGENFIVVDHFEPDMKYTTINSSTPSASIGIRLTTVNYPNDTASMTELLTMTSSMEYLTARVRGRQIKWDIFTNDATSWWRMGNIRYRWGGDGRR